MIGWWIVIGVVALLAILAVFFLLYTPARSQNNIIANNGIIAGINPTVSGQRLGDNYYSLPVGLTNPNSVNNDRDMSLSNADKRRMALGPVAVDNANYITNLNRKKRAYYNPIFGQPAVVRFPCMAACSINNITGTYPVSGCLTSGTWDINLQARYTIEQLIADLQGRTFQDYGEYQIAIDGKMIGGIIHGQFYPVENMPSFPTGIYTLQTTVGCSSRPFELIVVDFSQYQ